MKTFRHVKLSSYSTQFADYGEIKYYLMPFDPTVEVGEIILFSEYDNTGAFMNAFLGSVFHLDICQTNKQMLLMLKAYNEAGELLHRIRDIEKKRNVTRKAEFLKERCCARYMV